MGSSKHRTTLRTDNWMPFSNFPDRPPTISAVAPIDGRFRSIASELEVLHCIEISTSRWSANRVLGPLERRDASPSTQWCAAER